MNIKEVAKRLRDTIAEKEAYFDAIEAMHLVNHPITTVGDWVRVQTHRFDTEELKAILRAIEATPEYLA
jgi:hypothetical protein